MESGQGTWDCIALPGELLEVRPRDSSGVERQTHILSMAAGQRNKKHSLGGYKLGARPQGVVIRQ